VAPVAELVGSTPAPMSLRTIRRRIVLIPILGSALIGRLAWGAVFLSGDDSQGTHTWPQVAAGLLAVFMGAVAVNEIVDTRRALSSPSARAAARGGRRWKRSGDVAPRPSGSYSANQAATVASSGRLESITCGTNRAS